MFTLDHVDVSYNSTPVLRSVSFDVRSGEFLGIIGPNGSGKSTLLKMLAGTLTPSSGSAKLDGKVIHTIPGRELARHLAVVPQENPVTFDYSVLEIVLMGRSPHLGRFQLENTRDLEIAINALKRTNLLSLADRKIGELSGGERQRAMIARALAQETEIIFLDEPTSHLDINYQVEILHLARRENRDHGKTIIAVLHDLNLASEFCDRLVILKAGQVYATGSPDDVITAENVQQVYGTAVWVRKHPTSGRPYVLSLGSRAVASRFTDAAVSQGPKLKVHVVCGGGSGGSIFLRLLEAGCEVTAGVINIGDTDQEAAESLGIEYVEDAPFSPISETAERANLEFIQAADAVVIADMPFGAGNVANLRNAEKALELGKRVAVIGKREGYAERDFAGGGVAGMLSRLVEHGAAALETADILPDWVAKTRAL